MSYPSVSVKVAFNNDPNSTNWTDITDAVKSIDIKRGRQFELDEIVASSCSITLDNSDRRFDPTFTASPFYPFVTPMRHIQISATWNSVTYNVFTGYVERWPFAVSRPDYNETSITCTDAFGILAQATVTGTFAQKASGARISDLLAAASWITTSSPGSWTLGVSQLGSTTKLGVVTPLQTLDTGQTQIPAATWALTDAKTALSAIQDAASSELGVFFIDGSGYAIFHDRQHRLKLTTPSVTFTDASTSASRLNYETIAPSYDLDHLYNDVQVTRNGGTTQQVTDATSITSNLRHSLPEAPYLTTDAEALSMATYLLATHKNPAIRFDSLSVLAHLDDNAWPHVLGREISDRVSVEMTPSAIPSVTTQQIVQPCYVEAVSHKIEPPVQWTTTYQLSPVLTASAWVLGVSALGASTTLVY